MECLAAILACSLTHGIYIVQREIVFEDLLAPNEPTAACFGNARSVTDTHCEFVSEHRKTCSQRGGSRKKLKTWQCSHRDLPRSFQLGILILMQKELVRKIVWLNNRGIRLRKCMSINFIRFKISMSENELQDCSCRKTEGWQR